MPWKETDVMSERIGFVVEAVRGGETMRSFNAEPTCRWDNRNKVCVSR